MIPGLPVSLVLNVHVIISLVAIATGLVAMGALAAGRWMPRMQAWFLVTTILTSVTGFLLPFGGVTPAIIFGVVSLIALAAAVLLLPRRNASRAAGIGFVASATFALYLNLFVLVVQAFQKLPALQPLAPTQSEPPFLVAQVVLLAVAVLLGVLAGRRRRTVTGFA